MSLLAGRFAFSEDLVRVYKDGTAAPAAPAVEAPSVTEEATGTDDVTIELHSE